MAKPKKNYRDIGLSTINIIFPDDKTNKTILELNSMLQELTIIDRNSNKLEKVFPNATFEQNHQLIHYVILVAWQESPKSHITDWNKLLLECAIEAGLIPMGEKLDYLNTKSKKKQLSKADLKFAVGSLTRKYFDNFLQYQKHYAWEGLREVQQMQDSLFDSLATYNLDHDPKHTPEVTASNFDLMLIKSKLIHDKLTSLPYLSDMHHRMLFKAYKLEELSGNIEETITESFTNEMIEEKTKISKFEPESANAEKNGYDN